MDHSVRREGQVFSLGPGQRSLFLIMGRTYHDESSQEVWLALELETGEETCFSEDFLMIKEGSRIA